MAQGYSSSSSIWIKYQHAYLHQTPVPSIYSIKSKIIRITDSATEAK